MVDQGIQVERTDASRRRILFADDETMLLELAANALAAAGFEVVTAEDGQEAVEKFKSGLHPFDVVVLDMTMPRLSGIDALRAIRTMNPQIRTILSSGFSKQDVLSMAGECKPDGVLMKPYRVRELRDAVQRVLDQPE